MFSGPLFSPDSLDDIKVPEISVPDLHSESAGVKDLFAVHGRKAWNADNKEEARCDFAPGRISIHPRAGVWFVSVWKKSVKGRTLRDIKADDSMIGFFAENTADIIRAFLGSRLLRSQFAVVTTPPRRHKERNFGELTAKRIADILDIDFYSECATAQNRQRVEAVFLPGNIPDQKNVIVFDDIVTTGSTLAAMKAVLEKEERNAIFFAGINNAT